MFYLFIWTQARDSSQARWWFAIQITFPENLTGPLLTGPSAAVPNFVLMSFLRLCKSLYDSVNYLKKSTSPLCFWLWGSGDPLNSEVRYINYVDTHCNCKERIFAEIYEVWYWSVYVQTIRIINVVHTIMFVPRPTTWWWKH